MKAKSRYEVKVLHIDCPSHYPFRGVCGFDTLQAAVMYYNDVCSRYDSFGGEWEITMRDNNMPKGKKTISKFNYMCERLEGDVFTFHDAVRIYGNDG